MILSAENLVSKRKTSIRNNLSLGTENDRNYPSSKTNPTNFAVGGGYTQGQEIKSYFDLNNNGALVYDPTTLDKLNITTSYSNIFTSYPNLIDFPYLTLEFNNDTSTIITDSKSFPLFKTPGKCFGQLEFYQAAAADDGLLEFCEPQYLSFYYTNIFNGRIIVPEQLNINSNKYPYSGKLYSGNLVQLKLEDKFIKVIPYQSGRGIPQYDPTKEYFSGNAYGTPLWNSYDIAMEPELAMGVVPGNNDACLGVSISTEALSDTPKVYKYFNANSVALNALPWIKWDQHPAPFTAPPENISFTTTDRTFSPENSNDNYYAPWPDYYAYTSNEPVPVCSEGLVTLNIGAATNIGAQAYYEPDVAEGDDPINNPNYISVSIVPLFQGEEIKVGNFVYATAMGNIITPLPQGTSPYPPPSYDDASGLIEYEVVPLAEVIGGNIQRDGRRDNPYYDYFDPTYGATGWTSTPQFILQGIPDEGIAIIESRNNVTLDYLNQSNQGSGIIHAVSTTRTLNENGSGRMQLLGPPEYFDNLNEKFRRMTRFPNGPGRALPVGKNLESIVGTGQWTYTGTILDFEQTTFVNGARYATGIVDTSGGSGNGATINITAVDANGSITAATLNSPGSGYTIDDILTVTVPRTVSPFWAKGTLDYYQNSGSVILDTLSTITLNTQGSNYTSSIYETGFNVSANNLIVEATADIDVLIPAIGLFAPTNVNSLFSYIQSVSVFSVDDVSRYPVGTRVAIMNDANPQNWAIVYVTSNDGATITLSLDTFTMESYGLQRRFGGRNVYQTGTYLYATQIVDFPNVTMRIEADSSGFVTQVDMVEIPTKNKEGDLILINQRGSGKNCIFSLENNVTRINTFSSKRVKGGAGYWYNTAFFTDVYGGGFALPQLNTAVINNPGQIDSGATIYIGGITNPIGSVTQASQEYLVPTYTGEFGTVQTIHQVYPIGFLFNQPGFAFPSDWPSFINRQTATFYQDVRFFIKIPGTGYTTGGPFAVLGGSGIGMTIYILKTTNGSVSKLKVADIGSGYLKEDNVVISSGNSDCELTLKVPYSWEFIISDDEQYAPLLCFSPEIVNAGTGYVIASNVSTTCPIYDVNTPTLMQFEVNILQVGSNGEILDIELVIPPPTPDVLLYYQIGYNLTIEAGNSDAIIKLAKPIKAKLMEFTDGGSNYTTATNVPTFNLTQNNLATFCGLGTVLPGELEILDYAVGNFTPPFWDLTRYSPGDILAFNQDGNISATAEIDIIDVATQVITFININTGAGYSNALGNHAYLPTINLTQTATTVDIVADANGYITQASINTLGTNTEYNDALIIEQPGSDNNAVMLIASERDVPAPWQTFENGRPATATEWNEYKTVMQSSVNLLQKNLVVDFKKVYPNFHNNSWYYYGDPDNKDPYSVGKELSN